MRGCLGILPLIPDAVLTVNPQTGTPKQMLRGKQVTGSNTPAYAIQCIAGVRRPLVIVPNDNAKGKGAIAKDAVKGWDIRFKGDGTDRIGRRIVGRGRLWLNTAGQTKQHT